VQTGSFLNNSKVRPNETAGCGLLLSLVCACRLYLNRSRGWSLSVISMPPTPTHQPSTSHSSHLQLLFHQPCSTSLDVKIDDARFRDGDLATAACLATQCAVFRKLVLCLLCLAARSPPTARLTAVEAEIFVKGGPSPFALFEPRRYMAASSQHNRVVFFS
jgi:hypothetical protein